MAYFLFRNYLTNILLIKFNRAILVIFIISIINYYININILFYIILSSLVMFVPIKKIFNFKISYKLISFIYLLTLILLIIANPLTTIIHKSDRNFNLHYILSNKFFQKNHFKKIKIDQKKINEIFKEKCLKGDDCSTFGKKPILTIGDTQMHQYLFSINNLENFYLIYSKIKKQCLFSSKLKHANLLKYYLRIEESKDCSENFNAVSKILHDSKNFNEKKLILISSWYNWYFKTQLILNETNQVINEELAYKILLDDLDIFLKTFQNSSDLDFVFILPLPRFNHSPNSCYLNNQSCIIKYSEYIGQIYKLKKVFDN